MDLFQETVLLMQTKESLGPNEAVSHDPQNSCLHLGHMLESAQDVTQESPGPFPVEPLYIVPPLPGVHDQILIQSESLPPLGEWKEIFQRNSSSFKFSTYLFNVVLSSLDPWR